MGCSFSRQKEASKQVRVLILGLDGAGKTTLLYRLAERASPSSVGPTVGSNNETVRYKNCTLSMWDVGGEEKIRQLWRHYYSGAQTLMFVVDSADVDRLGEARNELSRVMQDLPATVAVLVVANKNDLSGALSTDEVARRLHLNKLQNWHIVAANGLTGEGLSEGLSWLVDRV